MHFNSLWWCFSYSISWGSRTSFWERSWSLSLQAESNAHNITVIQFEAMCGEQVSVTLREKKLLYTRSSRSVGRAIVDFWLSGTNTHTMFRTLFHNLISFNWLTSARKMIISISLCGAELTTRWTMCCCYKNKKTHSFPSRDEITRRTEQLGLYLSVHAGILVGNNISKMWSANKTP